MIYGDRYELRIKQERFAGRRGFAFHYPAGSDPAAGYLLLSRYDADRARSIVELVDLNAQKTIHEWAPDFAEINDSSAIESRLIDLHRDNAPARARAIHPAVTPDGDLVFSADELSSTVTCHRYDATDGTLTALSATPATAHDVANQPAGIVASPCGRFVWVTNRGADTVAAFRVTGTTLEPLGEVPAGGTWPRGLTLAAGHLLVANQHSGTFAALRIQDDGTLTQPHPPLPAPSVVCALAL